MVCSKSSLVTSVTLVRYMPRTREDSSPGAEEERRWSIADMDKLIGERARIGILNLEDLGAYHRAFLSITTFLLSKNRISVNEQSRVFIRGFQSDLRDRVIARLQIENVDQHPDDAFTVEQTMKAASFVLHSTYSLPLPVEDRSAATNASMINQSDTTKMESIEKILTLLATTVTKAIKNRPSETANNRNSQNIGGSSGNTSTNLDQSRARVRPDGCFFCGELGHFGRECEVLKDYMKTGRAKRNDFDRVVLPNGQYIPAAITGPNMKARIDEWHKQNPNATSRSGQGNVAQSLYYSTISDTPVDLLAERSRVSSMAYTKSLEEELAQLKAEVRQMKKKMIFDGVEIVSKKAEKSPIPGIICLPTAVETEGSRIEEVPEAAQEPIQDQVVNEESLPETIKSTSSTSQKSSDSTHPFSSARPYEPPTERNIGAKTKESVDQPTIYKNKAPVQDAKIVNEVFDRAMKLRVIPISQEELMALSSDFRNKTKEAVTAKRVPVPKVSFVNEAIEIDDKHRFSDLPKAPAYVVQDPIENFIQQLENDGESFVVVARESISLRTIEIEIGGTEKVDAILDPGCQIIAMSDEVCNKCGVVYDPEVRIRMESANGQLTRSLGLARNVPVDIHGVLLFLQIHVMPSPAYEVLLGRPFDVLTESVVRNFHNSSQTIAIRNPNTGQSIVVPTFPRRSKQYPQGPVSVEIVPMGNFQKSSRN